MGKWLHLYVFILPQLKRRAPLANIVCSSGTRQVPPAALHQLRVMLQGLPGQSHGGEIKGIQTGKGSVRLSLFIDNTVFCEVHKNTV